MANTTSGTVTFDKTFAVDEIIGEAYERIGLQSVSGFQLKTARRSLNLMFQEWGNRGLHYWEVGDTDIDLVEGQAEYIFYRASGDGTSATTAGGTTGTSTYGIADVLEATYRTGRTETTQADSTAAAKFVHMFFVKRIQDADATYTDATDIPYRFVPCMASGLSFYLSQKYAPQRTQELKLLYEDELARALSEDGSDASTYITPKNYYPNI